MITIKTEGIPYLDALQKRFDTPAISQVRVTVSVSVRVRVSVSVRVRVRVRARARARAISQGA